MYYQNKDRNNLEDLEERIKSLIKPGEIYRVISNPTLSEKEKARRFLNGEEMKDLNERTATAYYFDENHIWRTKTIKRADIPLPYRDYNHPWSWIIDCYRDSIRCSELFTMAPTNIVSCISRLRKGESYKDLCRMIKTRPYGTFSNEHAWRISQNIFDRHIGTVGKPVFYRSPENENEKTFDYMHVECSIVGVPDKFAFAKENKKGIYQYVLDHIKDKSYFKKYGVPINFLKIERARLSKTGMLYMVFGLKEVPSLNLYENS